MKTPMNTAALAAEPSSFKWENFVRDHEEQLSFDENFVRFILSHTDEAIPLFTGNYDVVKAANMYDFEIHRALGEPELFSPHEICWLLRVLLLTLIMGGSDHSTREYLMYANIEWDFHEHTMLVTAIWEEGKLHVETTELDVRPHRGECIVIYKTATA